MPTDTTCDTPTQFSIVVPKPATRLNMGESDATSGSEFGYPGLSLQAEDNLFLDVGKTMLAQAAALYVQSDGALDQFAAEDMTLASDGAAKLAATDKVVIVAGAGQGSFKNDTYSKDDPTWIDYNNLNQHYLVDKISSTVKALFYGPDWTDHQQKGKPDQDQWFAAAGTTQPAGPPGSGLLKELVTQLGGLGYEAADTQTLCDSYLKGMQWKPDCLSAMGMSLNWTTSEYEFLTSFDPYEPTGMARAENAPMVMPWSKALATVIQAGILLKRFSDVLQALIPAIFDNEILFRIRKLAGAVKAFNEFARGMKPEDWKKWGHEGDDNAWAQAKKQRVDPAFARTAWGGTEDEESTTAELTSAAEPYDISAFANAEMTIKDADGGTAQIADFSSYQTPASCTLTLLGLFTSCQVTVTGDATVTVDGQRVRYDAARGAWSSDANPSGWPAGFTLESDTLTKGGALFEATGAGAAALADLTFSTPAGASATLAVGSVTATLELASLNATSAVTRAASLAALLNGHAQSAGNWTATASGFTVTLTSVNKGVGATVSLMAASAEHKQLGLAGAAAGGANSISAAELQGALAGKGNFVATLEGDAGSQTVKVTHNVAGSASYLELKNPVAAVFFGADPAQSEGSSPEERDDYDKMDSVNTTLESLDSLLSGDTVKAIARPVFEMVDQVVEVMGKISEVAEELKAFLEPRADTPGVGILAGDGGITLASPAAITGAGHSITFIAGGKAGDPNPKKFIPGPEHLMKLISDLNDKFNTWLGGQMGIPKDDPEEKGDFNVFSSGTIHMVARDEIGMLSNAGIQCLAKALDFHAAATVTIAAHTGNLELRGPTLLIGAGAPGAAATSAQKPTDTVNVSVAKTIWLNTPGAMANLGEKKLQLGKSKTATPQSETYDDTAPKLELDFDGKSLGLTVDKSAVKLEQEQVTVTGKTSVVLGSGGKKNILCEGDAMTLYGTVTIGGVLKIDGTAVPSPAKVQTAIDTLASKVTQLETQVAALNAQAKTMETAIAGIQAQIDALKAQVAPLVGPAAVAAAEAARLAAIDAAEAAKSAMQAQLAKVYDTINTLRSNALPMMAATSLDKVAKPRPWWRLWG